MKRALAIFIASSVVELFLNKNLRLLLSCQKYVTIGTAFRFAYIIV